LGILARILEDLFENLAFFSELFVFVPPALRRKIA
jgi:hypothetical protein